MGLFVVMVVMVEFVVFNIEFCCFVIVGYDVVFVIEKSVVLEDQMVFFEMDVGIILMFDLGIGEFDVFDGNFVVMYDLDVFVFDVLVVGNKFDRFVNVFDGQVVLILNGYVVDIIVCFDFDCVVILCGFGCCCDGFKLLEVVDVYCFW